MAKIAALRHAPFVDDGPIVDVSPATGWPRLLSRQLAAKYLSVSTQEIDRLIGAGCLSIVRLPAVRHTQTSLGTTGRNRRVLIDRLELDALCTQNRERHR